MLQIFPEPNVDPRLIAANTILQLSAVELEQVIAQELDDNPALEMSEQSACPVCGGVLRSSVCARCSGIEFPPLESSFHASAPSTTETDESTQPVDPFGAVPMPLTLAEHLFAQLRLILDERDQGIALYVVGNIDEHGYLLLTLEKIAQMLQVEISRVQTVLKELQELDPAGIGARNISECLLIQLDRLTGEGTVAPPLTRAIIEHHLTELGHHQFEQIRAALHATRTDVEEAFLFIRANLHPYPAHQHYAIQNDTSLARAQPLPSVVIYRDLNFSGSYEVEIIESQRLFLRLNPTYQRIRLHPELVASSEEREHVALFLERARLFLGQLQRRSQLLRKVMLYLIDYQRAFLAEGPLHLRPLTQKTVAEALKVHVSIISRTIAGKFALLPSQRLVPLHLFFSGEIRVQELIRQMIVHEREPLSDARIARLLKEKQNITLSRQMVANYRVGLGIPALRQRVVLHRKEIL